MKLNKNYEKWQENKIYQLSIKNFPKLELYDAKIDKHINYIAIKYTSRPTPKQKSEMYNLQGMKVKNNVSLPHGIYIQNGKKVVVK